MLSRSSYISRISHSSHISYISLSRGFARIKQRLPELILAIRADLGLNLGAGDPGGELLGQVGFDPRMSGGVHWNNAIWIEQRFVLILVDRRAADQDRQVR